MINSDKSVSGAGVVSKFRNFIRNPSHLFAHLLIFLTIFVGFFAVPVFMMTSRQTRFFVDNANSVEVVLAVALAFVLCFVFLSILYWAVVAMKRRNFAMVFVAFVFSWVVLAGFLAPMTTADGRFEPINGPTDLSNLMFVFLGALVIALLLVTKLSTVVLIFFSVLIGAPLAVKLPSSFKELGSVINYDDVRLSEKKNIIVISLDGVPANIVGDVFSKEAGLKNSFKDFIFYPNSSSSAPYTHESLTGVMLGNDSFPRTISIDPQKLNDAFFSDSSKYDLKTYKNYSLFNRAGTEVGIRPENTAVRLREVRRIYKLVTLRLFTKRGVSVFEFIENNVLPKSIVEIQNSTHAIDSMTKRFVTGSDRVGAIYMHFVFTHFPNTLDRDCIYKAADKEWLEANQSEVGVENTAICGLGKLVTFLDRLKDLGVYDNSLVVFSSDHGKPVGYFSEYPDNLRINRNPYWGYNRYRPMLMIKPAKSVQPKMRVDDRVVVLDDLAKTTCRFAEPIEKCGKLVGLDLLDPESIAPDEFNIHIVNEKENEAERTTAFSTQVSRRMPLHEAMQENPLIDLSEATTREIPLTGGVD